LERTWIVDCPGIKHAEEILRLLEAVKQPEKVAIMHCRGHQKGNADFEIGNRLADQEAKRAAEIIEVKAMSLIPDGKIQTMYRDQKPNYTKEDLKLIEDLKGTRKPDGWVYLKDNRVIIPSNLIRPIVHVLNFSPIRWRVYSKGGLDL